MQCIKLIFLHSTAHKYYLSSILPNAFCSRSNLALSLSASPCLMCHWNCALISRVSVCTQSGVCKERWWNIPTSIKTKSNSCEPMLGYSFHHSGRTMLWNRSKRLLYLATTSKVCNQLMSKESGIKAVSWIKYQCPVFNQPMDWPDAAFLQLLVEGGSPLQDCYTHAKGFQAHCQRYWHLGNLRCNDNWQTIESGINFVSSSIGGKETTEFKYSVLRPQE